MRIGIRSVAVALVLAGALVVGVSGAALASSGTLGSASAGSWSGTWSIVDHGTAGRAAGNDYTWSVTLVQSGGTLTSTGAPTPYSVTGTASGSSAQFSARGSGSYVAKFSVTLSKDGRTFKGTWTDNEGNAGTAVGRGGSKPTTATISGTVKETDCSAGACSSKGLAGVIVTASGSSTVTATTGATGSYSLTVKTGTWKVTPSLAGRELDPPSSTLVVNGDTVANFTTCAEPRATSSVGAPADTRCKKKLDVQVMRLKSKGDSGWTESSGKKYLANAVTPVGFTIPRANGDFQRQCRNGCMNIRIRIRDAKTKKVVPEAHVQLTVKLDEPSVTDDAPNGVLCPASEDLKGECGPVLQNVTLERKRDLDLYYWLPGVVATTHARLYISVRVARYPTVSKTLALTLKPNVPFQKSIVLHPYQVNQLLTFGPALKGVAMGDFSAYCAKALAGLTSVVASGVTEEERSATLYGEGKAEEALKKFGKIKNTPLSKLCGVLDFEKLAQELAKVAPLKLWTTFRPAFGFPVHGLLGANRYTDRLLQDVFGFSQFYGAFNDGLVDYLYDGFDAKDSLASNPRSGDTMTLKIFEVSHRLRSGKIKDALYLRLTGAKQKRATTAYEAYAADGYWPGCWLDPHVNDADFTWFENSCKSDEP